MSNQLSNNPTAKKRPRNWSVAELNEEERRNLFGFLELLVKVDKRVNPHLYKQEQATK